MPSAKVEPKSIAATVVNNAEKNAVKVVFSDEHMHVVHKPYNQSFHSGDELQGFVQAVATTFPEEKLYPVHRLDHVTSGLMIFARSGEANRELSQLFFLHKIEKYYLALSDKKPKKKQGKISGDMIKSRGGSYKLLRSRDNPALTHFFSAKVVGDRPLWLFVLRPRTGKTHQLRVALKSIGSPVLGDARYKGSPADRAYLHAYKLRFTLFDKVYSISDADILGQYFSSLKTLQSSFAWGMPETLPWPK